MAHFINLVEVRKENLVAGERPRPARLTMSGSRPIWLTLNDVRGLFHVKQFPHGVQLSTRAGSDQFATIGLKLCTGGSTGVPGNGVPSSNQLLGAGVPHKVWRLGSRSDQRIGSKSGSTVR